MKPEVGDIVEFEVGMGNFFTGYVEEMDDNGLSVSVKSKEVLHRINYFDIREIYKMDENPEMFI